MSDNGQKSTKKPSKFRTFLKRVTFFSIAGVVVLGGYALYEAWVPMGIRSTGERLRRLIDSPQFSYEDDVFVNPEAVVLETWKTITGMFNRSEHSVPSQDLDVRTDVAETLATAPVTGLRITWLGHSTMLIELDGGRFLTDPIWGERTSPVSWAGPSRWYDPLITLEDLPPIDAVIISHDHYDHLDYETVRWFAEESSVPFVAPLGVGAHLEYWGLPADRLHEVDWWDEVEIAGVTITCTPSRHASGRHVFDRDRTLWAGYAIRGGEHNVFFSGDTGLFNGMREIGERLGPFDVTMLEVGAYGEGWPDWHLGPEQAVLAHKWLRGELLLPVHWALFDLASHGWTEPMERTVIEAENEGVALATPRPGESFELNAIPRERWWPEVPFQTAAEYPIEARLVDRE